MIDNFGKISALGLALWLLGGTGCATYTRLGDPLTIDKTQTVKVETVLNHPEEYDGKMVRLAGQIDRVCQTRGCWVTMAHGDKSLRVKFRCPIEGRFVPVEAKGHSAMVEGTFQIKQVDEDTARHFAEEGGATPEEVEKIKGPQPAYWMDSQGIEIEGIKKAA